MSEFFFSYGLFLAKTLTLAAAVLGVFLVAYAASRRQRGEGDLSITHLNHHFADLGLAVDQALLTGKAAKQASKEEKKKRKASGEKDEKKKPRRVFVLDFKGDIRATGVDALREEVTAVLSRATSRDEVVLRLENAGGVVHDHGLAASQLMRFRSQRIPLTVVVDKVAASGGYMMACVADRILAAPFAVLGSIGVLAQLPNLNRLLDKHGVDFEQIQAGEYKRTITMFGKNTDADREKMQEDVDDIHALFKQHVAQHRPDLDMEKVATGETWYGQRAIEVGLVDDLTTSDDYLVRAAEKKDVFALSYDTRRSLGERLGNWVRESVSRVVAGVR
ncbi:MAG: protease SohB [Gammaproteobacteria bacterium]|nr:protease SohB [Gammaproteobacteria bacterium]